MTARKELEEGYTGNYPILTTKNIDIFKLLNIMKDINRRFYLRFKILFRQFKNDFLAFAKLKRDFKDFFYNKKWCFIKKTIFKSKKIV